MPISFLSMCSWLLASYIKPGSAACDGADEIIHGLYIWYLDFTNRRVARISIFIVYFTNPWRNLSPASMIDLQVHYSSSRRDETSGLSSIWHTFHVFLTLKIMECFSTKPPVPTVKTLWRRRNKRREKSLSSLIRTHGKDFLLHKMRKITRMPINTYKITSQYPSQIGYVIS